MMRMIIIMTTKKIATTEGLYLVVAVIRVMVMTWIMPVIMMMMMKMMIAKQTKIVTVTAFDTAMMIQTVME